MIYLDNNATTRPLEAIPKIVSHYLDSDFGNPSSTSYELGKKAKRAVESARVIISDLINCEPEEVIFTSGGTESIYSSLIGSAIRHDDSKDIKIITSPIEHPAVNNCLNFIKKIRTATIETLEVNTNGNFSFNKANLDNAKVVSIIYANNETGIISPISSFSKELNKSKECDVFFHSDTVQLIGKLPFSFKDSGLNSISIAAHKLYGPKGIGAMIIKKTSNWEPYITGGGQENGNRGGTENVALIAAFAEAARVAKLRLEQGEYLKIKQIRDTFEDLLLNEVSNISIIGKNSERLPNTSSLLIQSVIGNDLVKVVAEDGLYISSGSACKSGTFEPSKTLLGMGYKGSSVMGLLRVSFGYNNTRQDAEQAVQILKKHIIKYRKQSEDKLNKIL